eukprot:479004-Pyramimonas_sp.AAC.1
MGVIACARWTGIVCMSARSPSRCPHWLPVAAQTSLRELARRGPAAWGPPSGGCCGRALGPEPPRRPRSPLRVRPPRPAASSPRLCSAPVASALSA